MKSLPFTLIAALILLAVVAPPAHADKCTGKKLKAIGKKEYGLLACQAKVAKTGDSSGLSACEMKVMDKFAAAFTKAGACAGDQTTCENMADGCESTVSSAMTDTFPSLCEAAKRKAAGKFAKGELGCYAKAAAKGLPLDTSCITKAQSKFGAALTKAGTCPDGGSPQSEVENNCVKPTVATDGGGVVTDVCPTTTTSTSTTTIDTTTTTTDTTTTTTDTTTTTTDTTTTTPTTTTDTTTTTTETTTTTASTTSTPVTTTTTSTTTTTLGCVATSGTFCDRGDGTVYDSATDLTWEKKTAAAGLHDVNATYTWTNAPTWVAQLNAANFAGHNDWRLPSESGCNSCLAGGSCSSCSAHELETILLAPYLCGTSPCIASIFGPTVANGYWSATLTLNPQTAYFVNFGNGLVDFTFKTFNVNYVRAVRSGS
jgi:hypothetical protein